MKILSFFNKNIFIVCLIAIMMFIAPLLAPTILAKAGSYADFYKAWFLQVSLPIIFGIWAFVNIFYKNSKIQFNISSIHIWIFLLLTISTMSLIWAYHRNLAIIDLSRWLAAGILFFILSQVLRQINNGYGKTILLFSILGCCTVVTIVGILQHFDMFDFYLQAVSPAAGFGNRNVAMHFIMLGFPVIVFLFLSVKKLYQVISLGIIASLMFVYIQNSDNRAVMIGTIIELISLACWFFYFKKSKNASFCNISKKHILTFIVCAPLALYVGLLDHKFELKEWSKISPIQKITTRTSSIIERKRLILNTMHMIKDNFLLGVGFGNWSLYYPKYAGKYYLSECMSTEFPNARVLYKRTHNEWLQTFAEIGFLGFFCFAMVILSILYMASRIISGRPTSKEALFAASVITALLGVSANMSASFPLRVSIPAAVIMCYAAILFSDYMRLISKSAINKNDKSESNLAYLLLGSSYKIGVNTGGIIKKCFFTSAAIGCISASAYIYKIYDDWIEAHQCRNLAAIAMEHDKIDLAIDFIEQSLKINPADPDNLYYSLGNLYLFKNQHKKAIEAYTYSINNILPYTPFTYQMLATTYVQMGLIQHAITLLNKAIAMMPLQGGYYYVLGDALARLKKLPEALDCYKKALWYAPKHPWAEAAKNVLDSAVTK